LLEVLHHRWHNLGSQYPPSYIDSISTYCWNVVGSQQSVRFKKEYYKTLLEQEVAWFDQNDPHKIVTKVAVSVTAIETATGEKMSHLISTIFTSVAALFFAFYKCWELSVMLLTSAPPLLLAAAGMIKASRLNATREKVSYEAASSRTEQALSHIKTVKGLVGEDYELGKFETALR
jgi:ATP-binding cassette subfamily B (MDR/TAP) protein 1